MTTTEPEPTDVTVLAADLRAASARLRAECTGRDVDRYIRIAAGWLDEWADAATAPTRTLESTMTTDPTPADPDDVMFAWCFSHGRLHRFQVTDVPWCTADWIWLSGNTEADALAAKTVAYGDARFLHDLTADQQVAVLDLRENQ